MDNTSSTQRSGQESIGIPESPVHGSDTSGVPGQVAGIEPLKSYSDLARARALEISGDTIENLEQMVRAGLARRLKGSTRIANGYGIHSAHLLYHPQNDRYCIVMMNDLHRHAMNIISESEIATSRWGGQITEEIKTIARGRALGGLEQGDLITAVACANESLDVRLHITALDQGWKRISVRICSLQVTASQLQSEGCRLTAEQIELARAAVQRHLDSKLIRPYGDLVVRKNSDSYPVIGSIPGIESFAQGEMASRWVEEFSG